MTRNLLFTVLLLVLGCTAYAQGLGVNADGAAPHSSAMLDVNSSSKGVLIPRVALTGTDDLTTVPSPAASLLIYNSASAGSGATAVLPGFYFWSGGAWERVTAQSDLSSSVWTLGGNAGTDTTKHFIGTTDNQPLVFRVNNTRAGLLSPFSASFSGGNTSWGYGALSANTTGFWNTASGQDALKNNTEGIINTASGRNALYSNTTGNGNTASGVSALSSNTTGGSNTASGTSALYSNTTGSDNTASGASTLSRNTTGDGNTASGYQALYYNNTGKYNTASGYLALYYNTAGNYNTASGISALFSNSTGSNNTALGYFANVSAGGLTNATAIGYRAQVGSDNALVLGSIKGVNQAPSSVNVGIGTTTPDGSAALEVTSTERGVLIPRMTAAQRAAIAGAAQGLLVYQTDAPIGFYFNQGTPATPAWVNLSSANSTWGLTGNAGTSAANFIGTTDNQPLVFKVNNTLAGWLTPFGSSRSGGNTSWGYGALAANTTGYRNTATGHEVLFQNTTGGGNTASGTHALFSNTTGSDNTASGAGALFSNTIGHENSAFGAAALYSNSTGYRNTATGIGALSYNTEGYGNTASGTHALMSNTTGSDNTASGYLALYYNTTGHYNTANGYRALYYNNTGNYNTALGFFANVSTDDLTNATAIGARAQVGSSNALVLGSIAGVNNATRSVNVGIGTTQPDSSAALEVTSTERGVLIPRMSAAQRDAIASPATGLLVYQTDGTTGFYYRGSAEWTKVTDGSELGSLTSSVWKLGGNAGTTEVNFIGTTDNRPLVFKVNNMLAGWLSPGSNTSWGYSALAANTTGYANTASGFEALKSNTTGSSNTANGWEALASNTEGYVNTAVGYNALYRNTTGNFNTACGAGALLNSSDGLWNTATGTSALVNNTSGWRNTASGGAALLNNVAGSYNTALGYGADVSAGGLSNATALGANAVVNASNKVRIGDGAVTVIEGAVGFSYPSDGRYKYNVREDVHGLDFILKLRPLTYQFDAERLEAEMNPSAMRTASFTAGEDPYKEAASLRRTGFIAQEVEQAANAVGYNFSGLNKPQTPNDHYGLSYESFVVPLVKAVQEQQQQINGLRQQMESLKKENEQLKQLKEQVEQLSQALRALSHQPQKQ